MTHRDSEVSTLLRRCPTLAALAVLATLASTAGCGGSDPAAARHLRQRDLAACARLREQQPLQRRERYAGASHRGPGAEPRHEPGDGAGRYFLGEHRVLGAGRLHGRPPRRVERREHERRQPFGSGQCRCDVARDGRLCAALVRPGRRRVLRERLHPHADLQRRHHSDDAPPIAAGRIWSHLSCPQMASTSGKSKVINGKAVTEACDIEADFLFENCGQ